MLSCALIVIISSMARAQNPCAEALDLATRAYDEGRLEEVLSVLTPCADLAREQRWQAYRLLALAYLFEERIAEADAAVHTMLELNPRYEVGTTRDPAELTRLVETYSLFPRLAVGVRGGLSMTGRRIDAPRSIAPLEQIAGTRRFALGSDIGVGVLIGVIPELAVSVDALSSGRAYSVDFDGARESVTEYSERLSYLTVPAMLRYAVDLGSITTHVAAGYYYQFLLDATSDITMRLGDSAQAYADEGVLSTRDRRETSSHGIVFGAGLSIPFGEGFVSLDGRYELGLADVVSAEERYNDDELHFRYLYVDSGFRLRNIILSLGYVHPISFAASR